MKNNKKFFMLLIILMNCINSQNIEKDYNKTIDDSNLLYSLMSINKMKIQISNTTSKNCDIDCIDFYKKYTFVDVTPNQQNCTDNYSSGNGNNYPNPGEQGILRIPITYNGNIKISDIRVKLFSIDNQIIIDDSVVRYPELKTPKNFQFSCPLSYYENWNESFDINCKPSIISLCTGWRIKIPYNYTGNLMLKILFSSSIGDKYFNYSL